MTDLVRRLHIYSGLFTFWAFMVFGVAGLHATFEPDPRDPPEVETARVDLTVAPDAPERAIAEDVRAQAGLPATKDIQDWQLNRKDDGRLELRLYSPNGQQVIVHERGATVATVESERFGAGCFLTEMHTVTPAGKWPGWVFVWSLYNELAIFGLMFLSLSGAYLWMSTRPRLWWARLSFGLGTGLLVVLVLWAR